MTVPEELHHDLDRQSDRCSACDAEWFEPEGTDGGTLCRYGHFDGIGRDGGPCANERYAEWAAGPCPAKEATADALA